MNEKLQWLRDLDKQINSSKDSYDSKGRPCQRNVIVRKITGGEWRKACRIIDKEEVTVSIVPYNYYFGLALEISTLPLFPGLDTGEHLLLVCSDHFEVDRRNSHSHWNDCWEKFNKLATNPRNIQFCTWAGLELPKEKRCYEY